MKITGIRTRPYFFQLDRLMGDSNFPSGNKNMSGMIVYIDTDEGLSGISISSPGADNAIKTLEPLLVGKDPRGVKGLWRLLIDAVFKGGNEGTMNDAIGAIDVGLWDLKAKINEEPLWKTLGGSTRYVKVYASGIDMPLTDQEIADLYENAASQGISAGKLKVGIDRDSDLRRIGIMNDALKKSGKPVQLLIDSNEYWSAKQAIRNIRAIEERFEIFWVEEPARRWDYRGLRKVSQSVTAAVATGENLADIKDFTPLFQNEAVDVAQIGMGTSGITGMMKVADMAYGYEIPVSLMNSPVNYEAPAASAISNHMMMEVFHDRDAGILVTDSPIEDGYLVLGDTPGNGLSIDESSLAKLPTTSMDNTGGGAGASALGRRRGAGLLEVPSHEAETLNE